MIATNTQEQAVWKNLLAAKRDELTKQIAVQRGQIVASTDPEDEAAVAVQSYTTDILIANLERDIRSLAEVELALRRLDTGRFGVCESCGEEISEARLKALPWARLCLNCAQRPKSAVVHSEA
jgi:RNA polymerase-binding protein DksA